MNFTQCLITAGVAKGRHLIVHSSFKNIRAAFPGITVEDVIGDIKDAVSGEGSVIMPAFTYTFKKRNEDVKPFDREKSESKTGAVSEVFRNSEGVVRTSSPTHSFSLWGKVKEEIPYLNNPDSPLGEFSVMDWLAQKENTYALMLGVDFTALTFGHYLEIKAPLPWADHSPWDYMGVEKAGVSTRGEKELRELPGCSRSFINFENYLLKNGILKKKVFNGLQTYFTPVELLLREGLPFFRNNPGKLLCEAGTCKACDSRRNKFLNNSAKK